MAGVERPRARALADAIAAARRRAGLAWPECVTAAADRAPKLLSEWTIAEIAPGRLLPWLPVAFGFGMVLYFTADREPSWIAAAGVAVACMALAVVARRSAFGFPLAL